MRSYILAAICSLFLLLMPAISSATSLASPYVPHDHWAYAVCDYFVACGLVPGYPKEYFDGKQERLPTEFAGFICVLIDVLEQTDAELDPRLKFINLDQLKADLYFEFASHLILERLRPAEPDEAWQQWPFGTSALLRLTSKDFTVVDLAGMLEAASVENNHDSLRPYADVPAADPVYQKLQVGCDSGLLQGYPEDFFDGARTLTRYEIAQALSRLLDDLGRHDRGWWSSDLEAAAQLGLDRRGIVQLVLDYMPELREVNNYYDHF